MRPSWLIAGLLAAPTPGSVPPPPPDDAPVVAASCGATKTAQPFEQVPATTTPLGADTLKAKGDLHYRWGFRIATGDARIADVAAMELNGAYGLLAVTRGGRWLSLDLTGGTLAGVHTVGLATMKGASGVPTSVVTLLGDRTFVGFAGGRPVVARYALGACGAASTAVPLIDVAGTPEPMIVQGAYTCLGIVGRRAGDGSALVLPFDRRPIALAGSNPLGSPGRTIVAATNPARIVPEIVTAWRTGHGRRTEVALVPAQGWSDVSGDQPWRATPLAVLARTPAAMASLHSSRDGSTLLVFAFPGPRRGMLDLYAFGSDVRL